MTTLTLVFNEDYCWGCKTCEVACKQENHAPEGIKRLSIEEDGPREMNGMLNVVFRAVVCRHCDAPPCAEACPEQAITKRTDGIVILDEAGCSGCRSCLEACPYGAISFDPEQDVALKCNLCHHRVDRGLIPACADNICLGHCIQFGDSAALAAVDPGHRSPCHVFWRDIQDK